MRIAFKRITACVLALMLLALSIIPSAVITNAAPLDLLITITYNSATGRYDLSYPASVQPARTVLTWHDETGALMTTTDTGTFNAGRVSFSFNFVPDHIYDIYVRAYTNVADPDPYAEGRQYYLADITFEGESFNVMAKMSDIEDNDPYLDPDVPGSAVLVQSGNTPQMRLKWKIPTIYNSALDGGGNPIGIVPVTSLTQNQFLAGISDAEALISRVGFQISMNKGKGSSTVINFNTDYNGTNQMVLDGTTTTVAGINTSGVVTSPDGFVSVLLTNTHGIEPGTEYEYTNIGIIFENAAQEQIPIRRTKLRTASDNHFMVRNIDNAFSDYATNLTSIFTPMQFELTKVDVDKVEVKFRRLTNGIYPELYYQVQYAPRIDDLYTQTNTWVKIPNSTMPGGELYGSEIVTVDIPGVTHPEYYFRVVYYDSSSALPKSSSLCVDLRLLGTDSGKPPLPREIEVQPLYAGRQSVAVPSTSNPAPQVEIPMSDIRFSFEKPLNWKMIPDWDAFKNLEGYQDDDYTFHILLSTYLPDADAEPDTQALGLGSSQTVYMPVEQKRVLVLGKKDLFQDPNDPDRLYCVIPGNRLFYDYTASSAITAENNADPSEDGVPGDYPAFLVPNTTYYMQVFTSRYRDNTDINTDLWGNGGLAAALRDKISYLSPVLSFTTWPLNELPVPIPNITPDILPKKNVDPATGDMSLAGISVAYERILTETEWQRYTNVANGRSIRYDVYISRNANDPASFRLVATDNAPYPAQAEVVARSVAITTTGVTQADGTLEPIKPNTVYYLKAQASLVVGGDTIGRSVFTPVKAITTPVIDSGSLDNITRDPRSPSEFAIAVDANGQPRLSDSWVELSWLHAERDVTYQMICTSVGISEQASEANYRDDSTNIAFLQAYSAYRDPLGDPALLINVNTINLQGFTLGQNGSVLMPIRQSFLRPNQTYFFSLRAVRRGTDGSGNPTEVVSRWITIPVTTRMVQPPAFLEAVRDLEVGFKVNCTIPNSTGESMELYMKKSGTTDSSYVRLIRSQYSVVKDNNTYYFRIYNLEPNQWYDVRIYNKAGNSWYNQTSGAWQASAGNPVKAKTRDTLHEIEVRWEGEDPNDYRLEVRGEKDTDYEEITFKPTGFSDYGYDPASGSRIQFYIEKSNVHIEEQAASKYIYYAKIQGKPVRNADGTLTDKPLLTNNLYSVKLWVRNNGEDSLHVGPVHVRTDFSQVDYDNQQRREDVVDVYNLEAEKLTRKLYWSIDKGRNNAIRALIKGDMVSGLLKNGTGATVTVDLTGELENPSVVEVLIPQKVLEAIESQDARLNLQIAGAEVTLNRGSIDFAALKQQTLTGGTKEAMLKLRVERKASPSAALPTGFKSLTRIYAMNATAVGSRYTYAELNTMIYKILRDPSASGPFRYGLFDRELTRVLGQIDNYSYRSHTELKDMIGSIVNNVEVEMSRYLKDIVDGGSGLATALSIQKAITSFPGRVGFKLEYPYQNGLITPYVNYGAGWREAAGSKAYVLQYVLFRVEKPGEFAVVASGSVNVTPGTAYGGVIEKLGGQYDLSKVFGKTTILPANPISGQQAVMLYAVVCERDEELTGLTPAQKVAALGVGDVVAARQLTGYMDNQTSLSLAVKLYGEKTGIPVHLLKPAKTVYLTNPGAIQKRLYPYVLVGLDLGFAKAPNRTFDATGRSTTGQFLDMVSKVLEKTGR